MSSTASTVTASAKPPARSSAKSRIIVLHLPKDALSNFPSDSQEPQSPTPSSSAVEATPSAVNTAADSSSSTTAAPTNGLLAPPSNSLKRKGVPGPKPGMKRNASQLTIDGVPKPRGKPGPKKKMRVDGVNGAIPVSAPKLNPKANQGAINANLRALDRTGRPCRKWGRKGFEVKSFTGVQWSVPSSWGAPKKPATDFPGDVKSDSSGSSEAAKPNQDSSAIASEKSNSGGDVDTPLATIPDVANSPAPAAAVTTTA